jgi:hypothetical protein
VDPQSVVRPVVQLLSALQLPSDSRLHLALATYTDPVDLLLVLVVMDQQVTAVAPYCQ